MIIYKYYAMITNEYDKTDQDLWLRACIYVTQNANVEMYQISREMNLRIPPNA